jgi:transposase
MTLGSPRVLGAGYCGERTKLAEQYQLGMSALELARKYNVHRQTIARQPKKEGIELREQRKRTPEPLSVNLG